MIRLLDANVLIALVVEDHVHHDRASAWSAGLDAFATCPITEGALVRLLLRVGESKLVVAAVLEAVAGLPGHHFWPDDLPHAGLDLAPLQGYKQVTDAYLVALAQHHGGRLATLDAALAATHPAAELV
ncbi:MAG: PIN domain-containing protein [Propionibacteriaceae bacterium]|nr:PIN domain-containing protein [Propionibacteriaceae bacterium]